MSRRPTVLDTFNILDDHCNFNFMGVDVNGRTSEFVDASYRHHIFVTSNVCIARNG